MAHAPSGGAAQKKSRRPVLSPHVAHAHAFAAVPSPGPPKSASSSYFPLPTPPAPLRASALAQNDTNVGVEPSATSYPNSTITDPSTHSSGENLRETTNMSCRSGSRRVSMPVDGSSKYPSAPSPSHYHFTSTVPFSACTPNRSSALSSSSSASIRSALSIAEIDWYVSVSRLLPKPSFLIDKRTTHRVGLRISLYEIPRLIQIGLCSFFVQGSRSSAYSATRSNSSSLSRAPSDAGAGSASLSELGLSSNEEAGSDRWVSDEAERDRQREGRRAFMKARQKLREEARKKRASTGGVPDDSQTATWREVIGASTAMALRGIPESRASSSRGYSTAGSPRSPHEAKQPTAPLADMLRTSPPPPSGPGPPPEPCIPVDALAGVLSETMNLSEAASEDQKSDQDSTPDGIPSLNRFDSDNTAVGLPAVPQVDTHSL
ncbi:hypothetical protein BN14_03014 [Rhizoctonia solani AG-1 IB]|uniref:Uncharacterized protein n=1 Tax=Thanatephorus cucumeris (strain AG1-IB / isolate 7/3/14) TaxID=1108050 RepID=M5BZ94_THACB|nr:hypothetical protein BN14_03014 [Rhizoctonia solani AG-1 IB]